MKKEKIVRQLKVYQRYLDPEFKRGAYPEIRLRGRWIEETAGLRANDMIEVTVSKEGMYITKKG